MKSILKLSLVATSVLLGGASFAVGASIADQTFNPGDWSQTILFQSGPTPSFATGQSLTGGNPDAYRTISQTYGGFGSIVVGHIFEGTDYDPGQDGGLGSVSFTFDTKVFEAGQSGAVAFGALLRQGGSYYRAGFSSVLPGGWSNQSYLNLSAADFFLALGSGPGLPDFSTTGAPINFGFYSSNGTGLSSRTSTSSGVDNWSVTTTSVPEGGSIMNYATGLLAIALLAVARRRVPEHL